VIQVPFWWDKSEQSLMATIHKARPDINWQELSASSQTIPTNKEIEKKRHWNSFKPQRSIKYNGFDPTGWWMNPQKDGIPVFWDGNQLSIPRRSIVQIPEHVKKEFPPIPVEGLMISESEIHVFDVPSKMIESYESRFKILKENITKTSKFVKIINPIICQNRSHFDALFQSCGNVILRNPDALYYDTKGVFQHSVKKLII